MGLGLLTGTSSSGAEPVFPLHPSASGRYLVDQAGVPFPILGRSSWFIAGLSDKDLDLYMGDSLKRGFDAMEFILITHDPRGRHPPFNDKGDAPFLRRLDGKSWDGSLRYRDIKAEAPDFTSPNEAYWKRMDALLAYAAAKGVLALAFPVYVGYQAPGEEQGWMNELAANGPARMRAYGTWVADRYKNQLNIVWMLGGDHSNFNPEQSATEAAFIDGLTRGGADTEKFRSAEWASESIGTDHPTFGRFITLNGAYSFGGYVVDHGRRAYARQPVLPAYLLEEPYDEEGPDGNKVNPWAVPPVRRHEWWGWLSTVGGYMAGNGYVWPFAGDTWRGHLDSQGARDLARLNEFIRSIPWFDLVPSGLGGMRTLVTAGGSAERAPDYVAAAATPDGGLLVAYVPPAHNGPVQVDLTAMGGKVRARWFDPTSGAYSEAAEGLPNSGPYQFMVPWRNSAGDTDWVLVLDSAKRGGS